MNPQEKINLIKQLRIQSGVGFIQCKKILQESNWDLEQAKQLLQQVYKDFALKKSQKHTSSGVVVAITIEENIYYTTLRCETDSIPPTPEFSTLAQKIIHEYHYDRPYKHLLEKAIVSFRSNITVDPIKTINIEGTVVYIHGKLSSSTGGKLAIVQLQQVDDTLANHIAMNIVFHKPQNLEELLSCSSITHDNQTIHQVLHNNSIKQFQYLQP